MLFVNKSPIYAQMIPPPPPPNGGPNQGHGQGGNQAPDGPDAPIGGGIEILLALGAFYAGKKVFISSKEIK